MPRLGSISEFMFESLQRTLGDAIKRLRGRGRLTEANIREALEDVRIALLDADVNHQVAQDFLERVTKKAVGQEVLRTLDPGEQILKILYDELVVLMGPVDASLPKPGKDRPGVIMLCGLQGQGKTTTAAKLALTALNKGRKPLLVGADLQRPAAMEQLRILGEQLNVPVHIEPGTYDELGNRTGGPNAVEVCKNGIKRAKELMRDLVILDTAGRLHVAEMPMEELRQIDRVVQPDHAYFVCDALTGQDAVNSAKAFNEALELNGVILTKMDGDARGGAALSVKEVTKVPIKFLGVGEKLDRREEERLRQQKKLEKGTFSLDDFRKQMEMLKKMGSAKDLLASMPGMGNVIPSGQDPDQSLRRIQGMIDAMTKAEKADPDLIDYNRRLRIAKGSGTKAEEVKQLLNQFEQARGLMKMFAGQSMFEKIKAMTSMGKMGAFAPGARIGSKGDTGHRKSPRERAMERKKKKK